MRYQALVRQIKGLHWDKMSLADLMSLMLLSAHTAREFAESLRITVADHPGNTAFIEMAKGELDTGNLRFNGYTSVADHADFLWYFLRRYRLDVSLTREVDNAGIRYWNAVKEMPRPVRAMSIVSRERELPGIFTEVLRAQGWEGHPALQAFRYYLERHIELDSGEGGHADLLSGFEVNDDLVPFYEARLEMYRAIPVLFG